MTLEEGQEIVTEHALLAWAKVKANSGMPEESFTTRDREMFMLGYGAGIEETAPRSDG
jgi:hypothetical protein